MKHRNPARWSSGYRLLGFESLNEGLALFAGLNVIPKRSFLTEYSCRIDPQSHAKLMRHWFDAMGKLGLQHGASFDLDFHTITFHGEDALMKKHCVSNPEELVFDSKLTTYANLNRLNTLGINFMTLRRRSRSMLDGVSRMYKTPRVIDRRIEPSDYAEPIRQIIIADLGSETALSIPWLKCKRLKFAFG